ncbi:MULTISPECIES: serine/threonine protein kinase [unclassified Thioalkalivibrio]|uniref:serine/threonine protein kinase n=1 Tax=unclassified Thioalkalivibrio TaxID=2621013 RepID=UPI000372C087|nr:MULTISPECIES: serine/threonine protein kinase [unclassified Thioalkalivibrio]
MNTQPHPYDALKPTVILDAVETTGLRCDGRLLALNSYENRVYQIGIEDATPVIAKFYRPGRWTDRAILEEHAFSQELAAREVPVVAPLVADDGATLHHHQGFRFAVYPRCGGRTPDLEQSDTLQRIGRFIARIHEVGLSASFHERITLEPVALGEQARQDVLASGYLPPELQSVYRDLSADLISRMQRNTEAVGPVPQLRLHGDTHPGNILWTDDGPHFVDLDDACNGPAMQDLWMFLSGEPPEMASQLRDLLEGYETFMRFDRRELGLISTLRTLRIMRHAAWLARRADDPAFVDGFPVFYTPRYWEEHILTLREQAAALDEPALELDSPGVAARDYWSL